MEQAKVVGLATSLGISVVASFIVFIGLGILIDQWLDKSPLFTLIGVGGWTGSGWLPTLRTGAGERQQTQKRTDWPHRWLNESKPNSETRCDQTDNFRQNVLQPGGFR